MSFLYPGFLFALAVLAIPVIIHLFHFRRYKTIRFPDLRFLKNIQTERKNRNTLKHLLVLASRAAAFTCLVLAFSIPGCGDTQAISGKKQVTIFVDNSYSMSQRGEAGILFETAKEKAREIVKSYGNTAAFRIISHDIQRAESVYYPENDAIKKIDELELSSASVSIKKMWNTVNTGSTEGQSNLYIISDFQQSFIREIPNKDSILRSTAFAIKLDGNQIENLTMDSAWLSNPFALAGERNQLLFRLRNYSDENIDAVNVRLSLNKNISGLAQVKVEKQSTASGAIEFTMPSGNGAESILTLDDENFEFDNALFLALNPRPAMNVQLQSTNIYLDSALSKNRFFDISRGTFSQANISAASAVYIESGRDLAQAELQQLREFLNAGGQAILFPSNDAGTGVFSSAAQAFGFPLIRKRSEQTVRISADGLANPFFSQVFRSVPRNMEMPSVRNYFSTSGSIGNGEAILSLENGDPFLLKFRQGKGLLYLFTAPLHPNSGNFVQSVLFFPTVSNCAMGTGESGALFGYTSSASSIPLLRNYDNSDGALKLRFGNEELVPEVQYGSSGQEVFIGPAMNRPGFYYLTKKNNGPGELIALNPSRLESDPRAASAESLKTLQQNTGLQWMQASAIQNAAAAGSATQGMWRLFIWLAAAFFALEVLILVFWDRVTTLISPIKKTENK